MTNEIFDKEENGLAEALLSALATNNIISESKAQILSNTFSVLTEAAGTKTFDVNISGRTVSFTLNGPRQISVDQFALVYNDIDRYGSRHEMMANLLGMTPQNIREIDAGSNKVSPTLKNLYFELKKYYENDDKIGFIFTDGFEPENRENIKKRYGQKTLSDFIQAVQDGEFGEGDEVFTRDPITGRPVMAAPDRSNVHFGRRNAQPTKTSRVIDKLNEEEVLPGELYSDISRIPRSTFDKWLRFWDKSPTRGRQAKANHPLSLRTWNKIFILGYQIDKLQTYEVWYNSMDASFSVHDYRGNEIAARGITMNEAVSSMFRAVAKIQGDDARFFTSPTDRALMTSFQQTIRSEDARMKSLRDQYAKEVEKEMEKEASAKVSGRKGDRLVSAIRDIFGGDSNKKFNPVMIKPRKVKTPQSDFTDRAGGMTQSELKTSVMAIANAELNGHDRTVKDQLFNDVNTWYHRQTLNDQKAPSSDKVTDYTLEVAKRIRDDIKAHEERQRKSPAAIKARVDNLWQVTQSTKMAISGDKKKAAKVMFHEWLMDNPNADDREATDKINNLMAQFKFVQDSENLEKTKAKKASNPNLVTENFDQDDPFAEFSIPEELTDRDMRDHMRSVERMRREETPIAPETMGRIADEIESRMVNYYDKTRFSRIEMMLGSFLNIGRGRDERVTMPTDPRPIWRRALETLKGKRFIADFIQGVSFDNKINYEIWYITEPNPAYDPKSDPRKTIASFYVFDATAKIMIRKYLPYKRNAIQVVIQKMSIFRG